MPVMAADLFIPDLFVPDPVIPDLVIGYRLELRQTARKVRGVYL